MNNDFNTISFKFHPKAFTALGKDLVTSDIVAILELIKNSYDAFAETVFIRFSKNSSGKTILEIEDDGIGMSKEIIETVWCTVATPFKERNKIVKHKDKVRRVTGEKGLGRLSSARLGKQLKMITKKSKEPTIELNVSWENISSQNELENSFVQIRELSNDKTFQESD